MKIKVSTLKRNQKDYNSYNNENKQLEQKLEQLKEQNADETDIKKMNEQILETAQMLPNSKVRIENALEDLKNFMSENEDNEELRASEDWQLAEGTIAEISTFIESI